MSVRIPRIVLLVLVVFVVVVDAPAQSPSPGEAVTSPDLDLLDRGSVAPSLGEAGRSPTAMMATLVGGSATPGLTMVSVVGSATMAGGPAFYGNFFVAPADFPTTWYPFNVTGVYAWHNFAPSPPASLFLGAGVAPGPFTGGMGTMWEAFGTAMVPVPAFMTPAIIGMPGNLATPLPVPSGMPLQGIACGLYTDPLPNGPLLGAIVPPASPRQAQSFNGPPFGSDLLLPPPAIGLFLHWAAGCYVSGASVPVELQAFEVE